MYCTREDIAAAPLRWSKTMAPFITMLREPSCPTFRPFGSICETAMFYSPNRVAKFSALSASGVVAASMRASSVMLRRVVLEAATASAPEPASRAFM